MSLPSDDVFDARAMIQLADVQNINDTGQAQTATIKTSSGAIYSDIEVVQMYGSSSVAPVDGAVALVFAVGGDPANMRVIIYNPSARMGKLASGDQAIFTPDGTRVHAARGGIVNIIAGNKINMTAPAVVIDAKTSVTITTKQLNISASDSVTITTPRLTLNGNLTVNGDQANGGDVDIIGDVTITGEEIITGNLNLTGNEIVSGGSITVNGVPVIVP